MKPGDVEWCDINHRYWPDPPGYGVYAVELTRQASKEIGQPHSYAFPPIYVGYSTHSAEERFWKHMCEPRVASRKVNEWGRRLRPDLFGHVARFETSDEAKDAETALSNCLPRLGFTTIRDGKWRDPRVAEPDEESERMKTLEHLDENIVRAYFDDVVLETVSRCNEFDENPFEPSADQIVEILTAGRGPNVSSYLILPHECHFAYMDPEAVGICLFELLDSGKLAGEANGLRCG